MVFFNRLNKYFRDSIHASVPTIAISHHWKWVITFYRQWLSHSVITLTIVKSRSRICWFAPWEWWFCTNNSLSRLVIVCAHIICQYRRDSDMYEVCKTACTYNPTKNDCCMTLILWTRMHMRARLVWLVYNCGFHNFLGKSWKLF